MKLLIILSLKSSFHSWDVEYFAGFSFPFLSTVFRFKGSGPKMTLYKHILQLKERLVISSTPFFMFHDLIYEWGLGAKGKLTFSWSLLKHLVYRLLKFQKSFACIDCFGLFTKIKKVNGTSCQCRFCAYFFFIKMFHINIKKPSFTIWRV